MSFDFAAGAPASAPDTDWLPAYSETRTAPARVSYDQLVLPGDYPDPTICRIGDAYWASATTAEWGAVFPLFRSYDLVHWELVSHVFPGRLPEWCDSNFWAPELFYEGGRVYLYYTARQRGGVLSVAVASAERPEGPYVDHGPLVSEAAGSIDGAPIRDEHGVLHLVWKNDGNSRNEPTPIWAQEIDEQTLQLTGPRHELFRNDAPWEGPLVEGSALVRHGGYFYMFYAGNACCGKYCTYAEGVARASSLLGPWEKCPQNPILTDNSNWKCPGHGTVAEKDGRWFLLHHAYAANSHEFVGRQGLLSEFSWNAQGWPEFVNSSPQAQPLADVSRLNVADDFVAETLNLAWQWPVGQLPRLATGQGQLHVAASPARLGTLLARRTYTATYTSSVLLRAEELAAGTFAGLGAVGDPYNALALMFGDNRLQLWHVKSGRKNRLADLLLPPTATLGLRLECWGGSRFRFAYSLDGGRYWEPLRTEGFAINGTYLPPWDRGVRVALLAQGEESATATFEQFTLLNQR